MTNQTTHTCNGLDLTQMSQTLDALRQNPSLAQFEFRTRNQWIDGGTNRSTIQGFYGAGAEDASRQEAFVLTNGEPPVLLGNNEGANPVEYLLHALAGCVTTTTVLHAAARGIRIKSLSTELTGNMDLQGLLALDDSVPVGYQAIQIDMHIEARRPAGVRQGPFAGVQHGLPTGTGHRETREHETAGRLTTRAEANCYLDATGGQGT